MKKGLSLFLVFVMLLSLCACGKDATQNTIPTTASTEGTTETTQRPTAEVPTETPAEAPTEAPTETPTECSHSWKDATCAAPKTCAKCGATEGNVGEHNYQNGTCTTCGAVEVVNHLFGTGTGYALTLSASETEISCYQLSASELFYTGYITEMPAEGYYVFREYNGTTYYAPAPSWGWISISSYTVSGRTVQLLTDSETLELELISENQYKVTKGIESIPAGTVFTFGIDMCSFMGHLYERSCENDVTCMYCGHFKCPGLGHEFGEDDICFRCFSVMRPES